MKTKHLFFLLTFFLFSCNAVKTVINSADKTQKVVDHYLKIHPFTNDTSYRFSPGDTSVEIIDNVDTAYTLQLTDTLAGGGGAFVSPGFTIWRHGGDSIPGLYLDTVPCKPITINRLRTIIKTVHDTLTQKIVDKSFSDELQRQNNVKAQTITDLTANLKTETAAHRKWVLFFWLLIAAIIGWLTKGIWAPGLSKILTLFK